jgi:hypothetical protein
VQVLLVLGIWLASSVLVGLLAGRFFQVSRRIRHPLARRYRVILRDWHRKPHVQL